MFESRKKTGQGMEIFESDPTQIEESFFSFSRNYNFVNDHKRDEDVVYETVDPAVAFEKFANTHLDTSKQDFSGSVCTNPITKDLIFRAQPSYCEAPSERYKRIMNEINGLKKEFKDLASVKGVSTLTKGVDTLTNTMQEIKSSEKYTSLLTIDVPFKEESVPTRGACEFLKDEIKKIESQVDVKEQEAEKKSVSYECYGLGGGASSLTSEIISMDSRLSTLEKTIGTTSLSMMPDIRTGILFLSRKMSGLDGDKKKNAEKRMKTLLHEMKNFEKDKNKLAGAKKSEYQSKIAELYSMMGRWDQSTQQLPIITARMQTIKDIVDAGKDSRAQLKTCISEKDLCLNLLKGNQELLVKNRKDLQDSLGQLKAMFDLEKNFKDMENKMKKVR